MKIQYSKKNGYEYIGYCDARRLLVRPMSDSYAFMFEKNGDKFWFHVHKVIIEYCLQLENQVL